MSCYLMFSQKDKKNNRFGFNFLKTKYLEFEFSKCLEITNKGEVGFGVYILGDTKLPRFYAKINVPKILCILNI